MRTLKICTLACLLLIFSAGMALAAYPKQSEETPYVTDLAHIMTPGDIQKLNEELRNYNIRTTKEVVVVTVDSLDGMTVHDYALGLANYWGVGKAKTDNGVLFLYSPHDGELDIEVGIGMESILPESVTGAILDDKVIPFIEKDQLSEAMLSGGEAIMKAIDERTAGTGQVQNNGQPYSNAGQAQPPTISGGTLKGIGYFIILAIAVVAIFVFVGRRKEKARSKKEVLDRLKDCEDVRQQKLLDHFNNATVKLELLKKENPQSVWERLETSFKAISFESISQQVSAIRMKYSEKDSNHVEVNGMLDALEKELDRNIATCKEIEEMQSKVKDAKEKGAKLLKQLPKEMEKTKSVAAHEDVFPETKASFDRAMSRLQVAQSKFEVNSGEVNWLMAYSELEKLEEAFSEIQYKAESDKATAERARKEGPQLLKDLPRIMDKTEEELGSWEGSEHILSNAREEYRQVSNSAGTSTASDLQMYLRLIAINSALEHAKKDRIAKIEARRQETERAERAERRRQDTIRNNRNSGGGSFGGGGSSRIAKSGGGGGGSFGGSHSSRTVGKR